MKYLCYKFCALLMPVTKKEAFLNVVFPEVKMYEFRYYILLMIN
jgi:hypothetical protein